MPTPAAGLPGAARADLAAGRGLDALTELEKAAAAWGRAAELLRRGRAGPAREPREAVRQLDRVQADIARQFADGPDTPATRARLALLQRGLGELAAELDAPREARDALAAVADAFDRPDGDPTTAVTDARRTLAAWANATKTAAERNAALTPTVGQLIARLETFARNPARVTPSAIAEARQLLPPPDPETPSTAARQTQVGRALTRAIADAEAGRTGDIPADLTEALRQANFLAVGLAGGTPADTLAADLALRQRLLAGPDAAGNQRAIARALRELPATGVGVLLADATEAVRDLDNAWAGPTAPDATRTAAAAEASPAAGGSGSKGPKVTRPVGDGCTQAGRGRAAFRRPTRLPSPAALSGSPRKLRPRVPAWHCP